MVRYARTGRRDEQGMKTSAWLGAAALALMVAGCGSQEPSTLSDTASTPSTASEPTPTEPGTSEWPPLIGTPLPPPAPVPDPIEPPAPAAPAEAPAQAEPECDPNYAGACVPIAGDVDCAGGSGNGPAYVDGPVRIIGADIYGLDRNNDGIGCE
jgi:hypothetical protein